MAEGRSILGVSLLGVLGGSVIGALLTLGIGYFKGVPAGLLNSPYCGACGALVAGLFIASRHQGPDGYKFLLCASAGLLVGLWIPYAAWLMAPGLGYQVGPFKSGSQIMLALVCGLVGAWVGGRQSKLDQVAAEIRRKRLEGR